MSQGQNKKSNKPQKKLPLHSFVLNVLQRKRKMKKDYLHSMTDVLYYFAYHNINPDNKRFLKHIICIDLS